MFVCMKADFKIWMTVSLIISVFLVADWIITSALDNAYGIRFGTVRGAESQATLKPKFKLLTFILM